MIVKNYVQNWYTQQILSLSNMNLPIKIKRTLPSISLYSPIATQKAYLPNQTQPLEISSKRTPIDSQQKNRKQNFNQHQQFPNNKRISPQRIPIFQNANVLGNNNYPRKINNSYEKIKKSVTFGKNEENNHRKEANFNNTLIIEQNTNRSNTPHKNYSPGRIYKRKNIFQKSEKRVSIKKQTQKIIPVVLNIKQFSDRLKKAQSQKNYHSTQHESKNESKNLKTDIQPNKIPYIQENQVNQSQLLKKIYHIEHIIQDIQQKIVYQSNSKQEQQRQRSQKKNRILQKQIHEQKYKEKQFERAPQSRISANTTLNASQSQIENNLLKLQLEQMRRCERIAKQNEILYGKLVKEIEKSENQIRTSRRSSMISYPIQINAKEQSYNLDLRRINKNYESHQKKSLHITGPHITAFEDFIQARQLSNHKGNDQNMEITSPFEIAENRKKSQTF